MLDKTSLSLQCIVNLPHINHAFLQIELPHHPNLVLSSRSSPSSLLHSVWIKCSPGTACSPFWESKELTFSLPPILCALALSVHIVSIPTCLQPLPALQSQSAQSNKPCSSHAVSTKSQLTPLAYFFYHSHNWITLQLEGTASVEQSATNRSRTIGFSAHTFFLFLSNSEDESLWNIQWDLPFLP